MTQPYIVDINAVAFHLGPIQVHWYGLMYLLGFFSAALLGEYRRRQGHWWLLGAKPQRADADGRLDRMAAIAAAPVQRWLPPTGMDLRALGLKPPRLTLVLNGRRLDYGVMTPFEPGRYVRVGKRIAVIPAQYTPQASPARRITLPGSP